MRISIHAPLTGCDTDEILRIQDEEISIHAPLTGCDLNCTCNNDRQVLFQSTHPLRDATADSHSRWSDHWHFNPRTPYGMRPRWVPDWFRLVLFQSTHPLRDATSSAFSLILAAVFQSTHPLRDATYRAPHHGEDCLISIHAPLTGCDCCTVLYTTYDYDFNPRFNPRTPYGMRQERVGAEVVVVRISIHAPLTGCDR